MSCKFVHLLMWVLTPICCGIAVVIPLQGLLRSDSSCLIGEGHPRCAWTLPPGGLAESLVAPAWMASLSPVEAHGGEVRSRGSAFFRPTHERGQDSPFPARSTCPMHLVCCAMRRQGAELPGHAPLPSRSSHQRSADIGNRAKG